MVGCSLKGEYFILVEPVILRKELDLQSKQTPRTIAGESDPIWQTAIESLPLPVRQFRTAIQNLNIVRITEQAATLLGG